MRNIALSSQILRPAVRIFLCTLPFVFLGSPSLLFSQDNSWTDKSGKYKVEATFEGIEDGKVKLKRTDNGKIVIVPLDRLSEPDQAKAKKLQAQNNSPNKTPSKTDTPKSKTDSAPAKSSSVKLSAKAKWSNFIDLDDNNKPKPPNVELVVTATGPDAKNAIEVGFMKITEALDNNGKMMATKKPLSDFFDKSKKYEKVQDRGTDFFAKHPVDGVNCSFDLLRTSNITSLKSVKGSFKIKTGGERETIKVEKVISNTGPVTSDSLQKAGIKATIKRPNPDSLEIKLEGTDLSAAYRVAVLDPDGKKLKAQNGSSWGGFNKSMTYNFSFNRSIPGDATVFIFLATGTVEKEIPFEFKNLKLPKEKNFGF